MRCRGRGRGVSPGGLTLGAMKYLVLAVGLLVGRVGYGQQAAPFRGANAIRISPSGGQSPTLKQLALAIEASGYTIDTLTETKLVTVPRLYELRRNGVITPSLHVFTATLSGPVALVTGAFRVQLATGQQFEGQMGWYSKEDNSQDKAAFTQAQRFAESCKCGRITYLAKP